jgi:hypothetical protein
MRVPPALQDRPNDLNYSDERRRTRADNGEPEPDGPGLAFYSGAGHDASTLGGQTLHSPDNTVANSPDNKSMGHENDRRRMTFLPRQEEE